MVLWAAKLWVFKKFILISHTNICKMYEDAKNYADISAKMENYRKEHGISYTFIANRTETTPSYVRKILLNKLPLSENMRQKINALWQTTF